MSYNAKKGPISKSGIFSTQEYDLIVDLESKQKIIHFKKNGTWFGV